MPTLQADLELEVQQAEASISSLDEQFQAMASSLAEALVAAVEQAAATASAIQIDADTSAAEAAISALENEAEGASPTVDVDADTSEAESSLETLESQAESVSSSLDGVGTAAGAASAGADLMTGSAAGLGSAFGDLDKEAAGVVAGVTAVAGAAALMFSEALEAQSAVFRLRQELGPLAQSVETINVGTLNADLSELAIQLGSSDDAMRNAIANLVQMGDAIGLPKRESRDFAEQVTALAARAVALNPALGDVGTVADSMSRGLARGGRFAERFKIALTPQEIEERAQALFGMKEAYTQQEKSIAGASVAIEKYGKNMKRDIEEGSKNPEIRLRALQTRLKEFIEDLGQPLVPTVFEALEAGIPVAEAAGQLLAQIARSTLPLITTAARIAGPLLQLLADALELVTDALDDVGISGTVAGTVIGTLIAPGLGTVVGLALGAASDLGLFGDSAEDAGNSVEELGKKSDEALDRMARNLAALDGMDLFGDKVDVGKIALNNLRDAADENLGTAQRLGEAYVKAGLITEGQYTRAINTAVTAQRQANSDQQAGTALLDGSSTAYADATAAVDAYRLALEELNAGRSSAFQSETDLARANQELMASFIAAKGSIDPYSAAGQNLRDKLIGAADAARQSSADILLSTGSAAQAAIPLDNLRRNVETLAASLGIDPTPFLQAMGLIPAGADTAKRGIETADIPGTARKSGGDAGRALGQSFAQNLGQTRGGAATSGRQLASSAGEGTRGTGAMRDAGIALGQSFAQNLRATSGAASGAGGALSGAAAGGTRGTGGMAAAGSALGQAFADSVRSKQGEAFAAGQTLARAAADGANNAGSPSVHLFSDAAKEQARAYGAGLGAEQPFIVREAERIVRSAARELDAVTIGRTIAGALGTQAGGSKVVLVKVGSMRDAAAHVPSDVHADLAFLEF